MNSAIDMDIRDRKILFTLLSQYLPDTSVWAFGSRITGSAKPWSDLDLVVFTGKEQKCRLSELREAFEESNLSFRIQLLEWDYLPENFKANILASHTVIANTRIHP